MVAAKWDTHEVMIEEQLIMCPQGALYGVASHTPEQQ